MRRLPTTRRAGSLMLLRLAKLGLVLLALLGSFAVPTARADRCYLFLIGITGDVTTPGFENTIAVLSFSLGAVNSGTINAAGVTSEQGTAVAKLADQTSPFLFDKLVRGSKLATARITVTRDDGTKKLEYEFANAGFNSFQTSASGTGAPLDQLALYFDSLIVRSFDATGNVLTTKGWNFKTNVAI